mmetsp:Transcript_52759/g.112916  ORF Transcript_52759/g.112916 Transcript_52759/m.112916 type:complete len:442 (-) Transcript_52759:46-1371(-)
MLAGRLGSRFLATLRRVVQGHDPGTGSNAQLAESASTASEEEEQKEEDGETEEEEEEEEGSESASTIGANFSMTSATLATSTTSRGGMIIISAGQPPERSRDASDSPGNQPQMEAGPGSPAQISRLRLAREGGCEASADLRLSADDDAAVSSWSQGRLREYLEKIPGLDAAVLSGDADELVNTVLNVETQCLRLFGDRVMPPIQLMVMARSDPDKMSQMLAKQEKGQSPRVAELMSYDVHKALETIEAEEAAAEEDAAGVGWLGRVTPNWNDGVALTRSMFVSIDRRDIPAMARCSEKCSSSMYSFSVLVTLMRAVKFGAWTPVLRMWSFRHPPRGCRLIAGVMPETFWGMDVETLDSIFQHMDIRTLKEGEEATCGICLGDMEANEQVRQLRCEHRFHTACIGEWIERQWGEATHILNLTAANATMQCARCPLCRASIGV